MRKRRMKRRSGKIKIKTKNKMSFHHMKIKLFFAEMKLSIE